jgi:hypothetical protein
MGDHPNLRGLYLVFDLGRVDERSGTDFFSHSGYDHNVLHVHSTGLLEANRLFPFAQRGQSRKNPMAHTVGARKEQSIE